MKHERFKIRVINPNHWFSEDKKKRVADRIEVMRKRNGSALGFIPQRSFLKAILRDRIFVAVEFEHVLGFVMWGKVRETVSVYMLCVTEMHRRKGIGTKLIREVISAQNQADIHIQCRVREDLSANYFWKDIGFNWYDSVEGGKVRGLLINRYEIHIKSGEGKWLG